LPFSCYFLLQEIIPQTDNYRSMFYVQG